MVNIYNVAEAAKVSIKTVSRVLNDETKVRAETRLKELTAIEKLGYYPSIAARTMVTQKTGLIGLITSAITSASKVPELAGLPSIDLVKGIQSIVESSGKTLMIADTGGVEEHAENLAQTFREHRVEGMIYVSDYSQPIEVPSSFMNFPSILINCFDPLDEYPAIIPDDEVGGFRMAEAAINNGHRHIGFLSLPTERIAGLERQKGFKRAHVEMNVPLNEDMIIPSSKEGANFEIENKLMEDGLSKLLSLKDKPTAICCGNDRMAMNLYRLLNKMGYKIPSDMSVIGFDNYTMISELMEPGLTTVELPYIDIGKVGAEILLSTLQGENNFKKHKLKKKIPGKIVWRNSLKQLS